MLIFSRTITVLFWGATVLCVIIAGTLAITEARETESIDIGDVREKRIGLVSSVEANVTNRSDDVQCPEIRAAARDIEAKDIAPEKVAEPLGEPRWLGPGRTVVYRADLAIPEREYREELDEIRLYVFELPDCSRLVAPGAQVAG